MPISLNNRGIAAHIRLSLFTLKYSSGLQNHAGPPLIIIRLRIRMVEMEKARFISIRVKLIAAFMVLALIPLIVLSIINTNSTIEMGEQVTGKVETELLTQALSTLSNIAQTNADKVDLLTEQHKNDIKTLSKFPSIKPLLVERSTNANWVNSPARASMDSYLKDLQSARPEMSIIRVTYKDGYTIARMRNGSNSLIDSATGKVEFKKDKLWFQVPLDPAKIQDNGIYVSALNIGRTNNKPEIRYSVPLIVNNNRVGVLNINFTASTITKSVANMKFGKSGYSFMIDKNYEDAEGKAISGGLYLSHPYYKICDEKNPGTIIDVNRLNGETGFLTFNDKGKEWTAAYKKVNLEGHNWYVIAALPTVEIMNSANTLNNSIVASVKDLGRNSWLLALLTILVVAIASVLISRQITNPVRRLTEIADRVSMGDPNVSVDIKSNDEIGLLAAAFSRLVVSIKFLMNDDMDKSA
jgi:HAMP domain-containing protein